MIHTTEATNVTTATIHIHPNANLWDTLRMLARAGYRLAMVGGQFVAVPK
jgi:hypothetical protein